MLLFRRELLLGPCKGDQLEGIRISGDLSGFENSHVSQNYWLVMVLGHWDAYLNISISLMIH